MIYGMKLNEILDDVCHKDADILVYTSGGRFSYYGDPWGRAILHPRGHGTEYQDLYNVKKVVDLRTKRTYIPSDSFWMEVPEGTHIIYGHDPRDGTPYEARIKKGEIIRETNSQHLISELVKDYLKVDEIHEYEEINFIYEEMDGTEYEGTVHII